MSAIEGHDAFAPAPRGLRLLLTMVRPQTGERRGLALSVALAAGATGAAVALLATSGYLISRAAQRPMIISLMVTIVAVRAFGIARAALRYAERLTSHSLALRQLGRLRSDFYRRLAPLVPGGLHGVGRGDLLARFVSDVDTLQDAHLRVVIPALVAVAVIAGASLAAWLMLGVAGIVVLVALSTIAVVTAWTSRSVAARSVRDQAPARARLTGQLVEAIDGAAELALAGRADAYARRLAEGDARWARTARRDAVAGAVACGLHWLLTGAGLVAVVVVGVEGVRAGSMPATLLAALAFLFLGACEAVMPLPLAARRLQACVAAASSLEEVVSSEPPVRDRPGAQCTVPAGPLDVQRVSFRYDDDWVLRDVSLRVAPGERVALVGPSGAGKTTLAELLVRFADPTRGQVCIGGADLEDLTQDAARRAVLLCGQDAHLFNTTVRENLHIAEQSVTEDAMWAALAAVEMAGFVAGLPDGLDTLVGQQGELLSGGQCRRLAVARALLSDARFLVFDEPVAHLDTVLAHRVMRGLLESAGERGVLVITHALDVLEGFDRVVRLEDGRLAPVG